MLVLYVIFFLFFSCHATTLYNLLYDCSSWQLNMRKVSVEVKLEEGVGTSGLEKVTVGRVMWGDDNGPAVCVEEKGVGGIGEWFVVGREVWEDKEGGLEVVERGGHQGQEEPMEMQIAS